MSLEERKTHKVYLFKGKKDKLALGTHQFYGLSSALITTAMNS